MHEAMQEKFKIVSSSEEIQILTLVPDKWSQKYCSEGFNAFEYVVWTSDETIKIGEILAKPAPKKEKLSPMKHFSWEQAFVKITILVVGAWKGGKQNFCNL